MTRALNHFQKMSASFTGIARWYTWRDAVRDIVSKGAYRTTDWGVVKRTFDPVLVYEQLLYATSGLRNSRALTGCNRVQRIVLRIMLRAKLATADHARIYAAIDLKR